MILNSSTAEKLNPYLTGPLNSPISPSEVKVATKKLNNGRAIGPDGIPGEMLKYGSDQLYLHIANNLTRLSRKVNNWNSGAEHL